MSDSVRPHVLQPTRLLHSWDFPGNSTGVGCHCLLHHGVPLINFLGLVVLTVESHRLTVPCSQYITLSYLVNGGRKLSWFLTNYYVWGIIDCTKLNYPSPAMLIWNEFLSSCCFSPQKKPISSSPATINVRTNEVL